MRWIFLICEYKEKLKLINKLMNATTYEWKNKQTNINTFKYHVFCTDGKISINRWDDGGK